MDILKDFGVKPILLAAQVVNFFILLFILKKFLYKPILKVLEERKKKIADSLKNAEEIEKKLLETEDEREKILANATGEAQKIIDEVKVQATVFKEEAKVVAQENADLIIKKGQEVLKVEREKMQQEIRAELSSLVMFALQKIIGKVLTKTDQKKIIDDTIKTLR